MFHDIEQYTLYEQTREHQAPMNPNVSSLAKTREAEKNQSPECIYILTTTIILIIIIAIMFMHLSTTDVCLYDCLYRIDVSLLFGRDVSVML